MADQENGIIHRIRPDIEFMPQSQEEDPEIQFLERIRRWAVLDTGCITPYDLDNVATRVEVASKMGRDIFMRRNGRATPASDVAASIEGSISTLETYLPRPYHNRYYCRTIDYRFRDVTISIVKEDLGWIASLLHEKQPIVQAGIENGEAFLTLDCTDEPSTMNRADFKFVRDSRFPGTTAFVFELLVGRMIQGH